MGGGPPAGRPFAPGPVDVAAFVETFSGSHRYVLDYLTEEVLERQPERLREFLLETSVLDRLSGPLCDAVTGRTDSQAMLETMREAANLFLVPLDEVRVWWRNHQLFADLLRARLQQEQAPRRVLELHRNAARWHEEHGPVDDAVRHAAATGDAMWAARLVERHADALLTGGEETTLHRWLTVLPQGLVVSRAAALSSPGRASCNWWRSRRCWMQQRVPSQTRPLEPFEPSVGRGASRLANVPAMIAVGRAFVAFQRGDGEATLSFASQALAAVRDGEWFLESLATAHLGAAKWLCGQLAEAEGAIAASIAQWLDGGVHEMVALWCQYLGQIQRALGRPDKALGTFQRTLDDLGALGQSASLAAGSAYVGMAVAAYECGDLEVASRHLDEGLLLCRQFVNPDALANGLALLAWIRQAEGDGPGAMDAMAEAEGAADPSLTDLLNAVPAQRARLLIAQGDIAAAAEWTAQRGLGIEDEPTYPGELAHLVLARVLVAQAQSGAALRLLERLHASAQAEGRVGSVIEIQGLRALAHWADDDQAAAVAAVSDALALGQVHGHVRVFVDEGAPMAALLGTFVASQRREPTTSVSLGYLGRLVRAFEHEARGRVTPGRGAGPGLVTPLSERELDVLRLLAAGEQNQEIADELYVSLNTVKKHVTHIFEKLGAANRTEAASRARGSGCSPEGTGPSRYHPRVHLRVATIALSTRTVRGRTRGTPRTRTKGSSHMQLHDFDTHRATVDTPSGEVSYVAIGDGPATLFVHGVGTGAYLWRNVFDLLPGRRAIALDLPVHGGSPARADHDYSLGALADALADFCDALGLTSIDLVANDTGGAIAQVFAARHPDRLRTLTLTNCDTHDNIPPEAFKPTVELAKAGALAPLAPALLADLAAARAAVFAIGYEDPELPTLDVVDAFLRPLLGTPDAARQFELVLAALEPTDLLAAEPALKELTVPTLVVWGTGDAFFDVRHAYWLRDTIPGVTEVVELPGARVFFPDERATELAPNPRTPLGYRPQWDSPGVRLMGAHAQPESIANDHPSFVVVRGRRPTRHEESAVALDRRCDGRMSMPVIARRRAVGHRRRNRGSRAGAAVLRMERFGVPAEGWMLMRTTTRETSFEVGGEPRSVVLGLHDGEVTSVDLVGAKAASLARSAAAGLPVLPGFVLTDRARSGGPRSRSPMNGECASSVARSVSHVSEKIDGSPRPISVRVSSWVLPSTIGMSADCGGASGSNGSRGSDRPSFTGPRYAGARLTLISCSIGTVDSSETRDRAASARRAAARMRRRRGDPAGGDLLTAHRQHAMEQPAAAGIAISVAHLAPPPDWPKMVTFRGSPPKPAALSRTHLSASTRSSMPALPESAYRGRRMSARYRKPNAFRR